MIYGIMQRLKKIGYIIIYDISKVIRPIKKNKIVLASITRDELSGNLLFINNEIQKYPNYEIIHLLKKPANFIENISYQLKLVFHISNSSIVIIDDYLPLLYALKLRSNTRFIQVWHALGAFKKMGFSRIDEKNIRHSSITHRNYDDIIVSSENIKESYMEAFAAEEQQIHAIGSPRTDLFFNKNLIEEEKEKLYNDYPELKNKRIILFAPTFRGENIHKAFYNLDNIDLDDIYEELKKNEVFVIKLHPFIKEKINIKEEYQDKIIDLSSLREINSLLLITDLLITDYSSVIFDYALLNKPVIYYMPDYELYKENRGFYNNIDEYIYGEKVETFASLLPKIHTTKVDTEKLNQFKEKYLNNCDGKSTERFVKELILNNKFKRKSPLLTKVHKIKRKIVTGLKVVNFKVSSTILSSFTKLKSNQVLFLSDVRDVLDGNLKYVYDYLDDNLCNKVVILKSDRKEKRKFKEKFRLLYYICTSKYIILDDFSRFISLMHVKKNQEICQLWHGAGAYKKFGYSRQDKKEKRSINSHKNYTKAIVTSESIRWCYAEGFGMDIKNVGATGMPRTDIFFDEKYIADKKSELYKDYPYLKGKKVILFAPTYRGVSLRKSYYDFDKLDIDKLYNEFKDQNYVFLFKWHPGLYYQMEHNNINPYDFQKYPNFYYDFSSERDINDLLLITDILITDYSSVIFDYALLNKPVIYFIYDYEEYNEERGLYFDFEDYIYGSTARNTTDLIDAIKSESLMPAKRKEFKNQFMSACDGNATKKTCEYIFKDNLELIKRNSHEKD